MTEIHHLIPLCAKGLLTLKNMDRSSTFCNLQFFILCIFPLNQLLFICICKQEMPEINNLTEIMLFYVNDSTE